MAFNPNDHLMKLKGKDYLPVAARLVWFRDEWPAGIVESQHIEISDTHAIFRATVTKVDSEGDVRGSATEYGSETKQDFGDFIEKASTKAVGRALAALGYGTSFAPELDEGARIVDSPVERAQTPRNAPKKPDPTPDTPPTNIDHTKVMKALHAAGKDVGLEHIDLHNLMVAKGHESMAKAPVDALIELGKAVKNEPDKLKAWLAKQKTDQAELLPSEEELPTPRNASSFTG